MGRRKIPYPPEFREEAVRLVREGGKSIGQVVKDLGIADQSLRNWVKQSPCSRRRWCWTRSIWLSGTGGQGGAWCTSPIAAFST